MPFTVPLRRLTALLLALVLLFALLPTAFAAEVEETAETEPLETAASPPETEPPTVPTEVAVSGESIHTEPTVPSESIENEPTVPDASTEKEPAETEPAEEPPQMEDYPIMSASSTTGGVLLFDQAKPNYTTYLSKQLTVKYRPNGTDSSKTAYIKNLGWHFARINGVSYPDDPIYCIEPHKNFAASTSGNYVDNGVTTGGSGSSHGSDVWFAMPASYREAIALTLLYSDQRWNNSYSVTNIAMASNPNVPLRIATQFLIYEIVMGLRDADSFELNDSNGYTNGDIFYNAGVSQISDFENNYNAIVSAVQAAKKIPSFTSLDRNSAPTITLTGQETVATDVNGVLSNFGFTDGNGAEFYKSGNDLYITQVGNISDSTVYSCYRNLPSAANSTLAVYYGAASTYQVCVKLYNPSSGNLNAYFKLKTPAAGGLDLVKTTEDGQNLVGWRFGIYSDAACTKLVSGSHTTDSRGKFSVSKLAPGTYYVKELGHTNSAIGDQYTCEGENPKAVTIVNGQTATVTFHNRLKTGNVQIIKTTNTSENLGGWKIGLFTDADCTSPISGSPFVTAEDGAVTVPGLPPGTYYAREEVVDNPFWVCDTEVKGITVETGKTATVTFRNTHYGEVKIQKTMADGTSPAGWQFGIMDENGQEIAGSPFTSAEDGTILSGKLLPGVYTVEEIIPEDSLYECTTENPQTVTVQAGSTGAVTFTNAIRPGKITIEKVDDNDEPLAGAKFLLEWSEDGSLWQPIQYSEPVTKGGCSNPNIVDGCLTSGEEGLLVWENLHPGLYYRLTEVEAPTGYQLLTKVVYEGKLPADGLTVELRVVNSPVFTLPKTGSNSLLLFRMTALFSGAVCFALLLYGRKKNPIYHFNCERKNEK